ncbi:MAG TPA: GAF domain-containing protein [Stenotrophomonas sp.]|nr:GAF domain-containing protein [Stenotrophomonas sp.]
MSTSTEASRQQALDALHLVGSLPEQDYQDIVKVAAAVCGTPVALISLIDRDRQWFKARVGLEALQTDRSASVCDHAIRQPDELFEVPDLKQDARFSTNEMLDELGARFYAGMPLVTDEGMAIGTVCVLDTAPRKLSEDQREALEGLSRVTMSLITARSRSRDEEVASILAQNPAAVEPRVTPTGGPECRVIVLEIMDIATIAASLGERALQRQLSQLDAEFEACLDKRRGDTINRVTDSGEFIAVLAVNEDADTSAKLLSVARAASERLGCVIRVGEAGNREGDAIGKIYLRAEANLRVVSAAGPVLS